MDQLTKAASKALSPDSVNKLTDLQKAQYLHAARMLLGSYRTGDANDPEIYIAAIIRVLSAYPIDVVMEVVDPFSGIPSKIEWLPKPFEVKRACEEIYAPRKWSNEWDERSEAQLSEREERENAPLPVDLKEKYGLTYGLKPSPLEQEPDKAARLNRIAAYSQHCIEREYQAHNEDPRVSSGILISRSLAESIKAK